MRSKIPRCSSSLLLAFCLLMSCGQPETTAEQPVSDTVQIDRPERLDSLYNYYYTQLEDTLPLRQVREAGKLYPVDEAPKDTAFFIFREQLRTALRNRDVIELLDRISADIKISFGSEQGRANFITLWGLGTEQQNQNSELWTLLERVLDQGGVFTENGRRFTAPYYFPTWPDAYDPFEHAAITGEGVRLRSEPSTDSQILKTVSYDIVQMRTYGVDEARIGGETHPWHRIALLDGTEGYVFGKYAQQAIGYRAGFERQPTGMWMMTFFLAGD